MQDTQHDTADSAAETSPASRHVALTGNRLDARDLFIATREITIAHGEETYRLNPDGYLMPTRENQLPPDTRYFTQPKKP